MNVQTKSTSIVFLSKQLLDNMYQLFCNFREQEKQHQPYFVLS